MKIFVCDDDLDILEFLRSFLIDQGHNVVTSVDCDGVINKIYQFKPDVIIFDYWLKDTESDKIIMEVKKVKELKKIPIILISAIANLESVVKGIPIDDYMEKPFDVYELMFKLNKCYLGV